MARLTAALIAILALPASLSAQDKPDATPSRAGIVLFKMPADRQRKEEAAFTVLKPIDPNAKTYDILIRPTVEAQKTVLESIEAHAQTLAKSVQIKPLTEAKATRSTGGFDVGVRIFLVAPPGAPALLTYVWALQSGKKAAIIEFIATDPKLMADPVPIGNFVDACRLAHMTVVVPGEPALTHYDIEETIDCLQWLLDAPFTAEQREVFRSEIIDGWKKKDEETIQAIGQIHAFRAELAKLTPEKQDLVRKQSEGEVLENLKKDNDRCSKLLVEIYEAAHKPIAEGDPALTRQQADAALELFYFIAGDLEGVTAKPSAADKDAWTKRLADGWSKTDPNFRKVFASMPAAWAATRAGWMEIPATEREQIKNQFGQLDLVKEIRKGFAQVRQDAGASASAAELQAKMTSNYKLTSSMLTSGYNSTITRMAGFGNMSGTRYTVTYRPK
jgi:hypothetical protein